MSHPTPDRDLDDVARLAFLDRLTGVMPIAPEPIDAPAPDLARGNVVPMEGSVPARDDRHRDRARFLRDLTGHDRF